MFCDDRSNSLTVLNHLYNLVIKTRSKCIKYDTTDNILYVVLWRNLVYLYLARKIWPWTRPLAVIWTDMGLVRVRINPRIENLIFSRPSKESYIRSLYLQCKIQKNWCTVTVAPTIEHHGGHSRTIKTCLELLTPYDRHGNDKSFHSCCIFCQICLTSCILSLKTFYLAWIHRFLLCVVNARGKWPHALFIRNTWVGFFLLETQSYCYVI